MNMRVVLASLVMFAATMFAWTYITDKGYEKIKPQLEKQKQLVMENQQMARELMQKEIQNLGGDPELYDKAMSLNTPDEYKIEPGIRPLKPEGNWIGALKGNETKIALAKFTDNRYWIMTKDPAYGDIKEKGKYDFQLTDIYFVPDGERDYFAEYEQLSPNSFRLIVGYGQYIFEKSDDIELDF